MCSWQTLVRFERMPYIPFLFVSPADVTLRLVRNPEEGAFPTTLFEGSMEHLPFDQYTIAPVKRGSLVLIDGKVLLFCIFPPRFFLNHRETRSRGRRKGGQGRPRPRWILKILPKKVVFLVSSGKKQI